MTSSPTLRKTPLADRHVKLGARMVDFGGWDMPLHFGSQIDEHHAVRQSAGMFDVSHMGVIDVRGKDARAFLRSVLANNVDKLQQPGKALYSCMLNPRGGILDDLLVYYFDDHRYRLVVNAATALQDLGWLEHQAQLQNDSVVLDLRRFGDTQTSEPALGIIAVQGPQARDRCEQALPGAHSVLDKLKPFHASFHTDTRFGEMLISRTGYTGEDGYELILSADALSGLWDQLLNAGVRPAGLGARDTLRLEAGMNLYGQDMNDTTSPLDCGLGWTVDLEASRNFIGKAALREQTQQTWLGGLVAMDRAGMFRPGQRVETPDGDGMVTSGSFSPTVGQTIALARLPSGVQPGSEAQVIIRGKPVRARIVRPPFVRNGKVLI